MNFAFVCVNKVTTPVGLIPVPLFNLSFNYMSVPTVFRAFIDGTPAHNLLTITPFSFGSEVAAPTGGIMSFMFCSCTRHLMGSTTVFNSCAPVTRWLDPTAQNGFIPNSYGMTLTMSQFKSLVFS